MSLYLGRVTYTGRVKMKMRGSVLAIGLAALSIAGCGSGGSNGGNNTPPETQAATPTFSPAAGVYTSVQSVTLSTTTAGASIYYTLDGSTPTNTSTLYSPATPIQVAATTTINAIAAEPPGYLNSNVATATYTINLPVAATPTFSPAPGIYTSAQSVTLSDTTTSASIFYTTDGSTPTSKSTLFTPGTPIAVTSTTSINAIATAAGFANSAIATGTFTLNGPAVSVVLSTKDQTSLMTAQPTIHFGLGAPDAGTNTVIVDSTETYQSVEGFGAAFTDSAADLLMNVEPAASLPSTLSDLFTTNGNGIGLSFMRIPMGASDIALSVYSYDDQPVGTTDPTLANFSIAHDQAYIVPLIKQAKALNPQMKLMANPWSPPGWMKDPTSMAPNPVSMLGGTLLMTPPNEQAFANYFVKFIQAYQSAGVPIDYVSLQNEPLNITTGYPSMGMSANAQLALLQGYVLPAFTANNITAKVFAYDHNWDTPSYPQTILSGLTPTQLQQMAGTAWHGYGGAPGAQQLLQNQFPALGNWETEHSGGTWQTDQFSTDILEITQVMRNSSKSFVKWSLALNEKLGPNLTQNAGLSGCNTCTPIITINSTTGAVTKAIEYYTLGHYSKYVLPGAVRVYSSNTPAIASVAFQNPDGSTALIASNATTSSQTFQVQWGTDLFSYTLPASSIATFTWTGLQTDAQPTLLATSQIQGSSFISESGLETEQTSDSTGEYDLGYLSQGSYAVYNNVDFGSTVSQVNVRTASDGSGGTATFYLDKMTNAPIATVNLPVTGGWQTWTTVNAPVIGASGMHTLYVVFNGSTPSIANVNWFQFQ